MIRRTTLIASLTFFVSGLSAQPCTTNDATNCDCLNAGINCDLHPDIKVSADLLLDPSQNIEYPQTGAGSDNGLLRVSVCTPNIGHGPLTVIPTGLYVCGQDTLTSDPGTCPDGTSSRNIISQRIYHKNGSAMTYTDRPAGTMTYHPSHGHMHVDDWGIYTLRLRDSNETDPLKWPLIAEGAKLAFCLMDYGDCSYYSDTANGWAYCRDDQNNYLLNSDFNNYGLGGGAYNCAATEQGISAGWTDIYYEYLPGMYATIPPGTCNGEYYIVVHIDPYNYFEEENENNNVVAVPFELTLQEPAGSNPAASIGAIGSFVVNDTVRLCSGETLSLVASAAYGYVWSTGAETRSIEVTSPGQYGLTVNAPCGTASAAVTVIIDGPVAPTGVGDTVCAGGSATLVATSGGPIEWFDAAFGGNALHNGATFNTPSLPTTTTFYAESQQMIPGRVANVGPADSSIGNGAYSNGNSWLNFDVNQNVTLKSVKVHSNGNGNRAIQFRDQFGVVVDDTLVNIPQGNSRVQLDFELTPGKDYQLGVQNGSNPGLWRNSGGASYPYELEGSVKIKSSSGNNNQYFYFYDWELQLGQQTCGSTRTAVVAEVNPLPSVSFSGLGASYSPSQSPVAMTGTPAGGTFSGAGVYANTFDPATAGVGDHDITYIYSDNNNCTNSETQSVHVEWGVGISDPASGAQLKVVPNVGDGRFEVEFETRSGNAVLQILDAAGRVVESRSNLGTHFAEWFDLSSAGAAVYVVEVKWNGGEVRERVVVMTE